MTCRLLFPTWLLPTMTLAIICRSCSEPFERTLLTVLTACLYHPSSSIVHSLHFPPFSFIYLFPPSFSSYSFHFLLSLTFIHLHLFSFNFILIHSFHPTFTFIHLHPLHVPPLAFIHGHLSPLAFFYLLFPLALIHLHPLSSPFTSLLHPPLCNNVKYDKAQNYF